MKPDISEFSYGFALTNELVGWAKLAAAPIFPSLIAEGRKGGGYDVELHLPGIPLFLQFKLSHYMIRKHAREYKSVEAANYRDKLQIPYYRFPIMESKLSDQHEMLLQLDNGANLVFYAAPMFHTKEEINSAWSALKVSQRSIFVAPQQIGQLDDSAHTVAFDSFNTWLCSTPKKLEVALTGTDLHDKIRGALNNESQTLEKRISTLITDMNDAEERGRQKARERRHREEQVHLVESPDSSLNQPIYEQRIEKSPSRSEPPITRESRPLNEHEKILREAADTAARVFDAQLLIVQKNKKG